VENRCPLAGPIKPGMKGQILRGIYKFAGFLAFVCTLAYGRGLAGWDWSVFFLSWFLFGFVMEIYEGSGKL
jgi:hypothetical protein